MLQVPHHKGLSAFAKYAELDNNDNNGAAHPFQKV